MIDKPSFIDSLNATGIALYLVAIWYGGKIINWFINLVVKKGTKKLLDEQLEKIADLAADKAAIKSTQAYVILVREEANTILNPFKVALENFSKSLKSLIKSNKDSQKRIAKIEQSLAAHRASEHKHRKENLIVLNFLVDSVDNPPKVSGELANKIKELRNKISNDIEQTSNPNLCN